MSMPYKHPAISIRVVCRNGAHISEIIFDAISFAQEMHMKVIVETCRGDLDADPTSTTVDLLEQWNDLGKGRMI